MEHESAIPARDVFHAAELRVLAAVCAAAFLATMTFFAPAPFLPVMAADLGVSVPLIGQVLAAMLLLSAVIGLVAGPLADCYGNQLLIVIGLLAGGACFFGFALAHTFPVLLLAALAGGLADAAVLGPAFAVAGAWFSGAQARRALAWTTGSLAATAIVGVPLLTAAGAALTWRGAFLAARVVMIGAAWLCAAWLPRAVHQAAGQVRLHEVLAAYQPLLQHRPTLRLYAVSVLRSIGWYGLLAYFGAFLGEGLGLSTDRVGLAYMLAGCGYFLGSLVAGGPASRLDPRPLLIAANIAMALLMGLAFSALLGPVGTVALLPAAGVAGALGWVAMVSLLATESPAGAATTMTLHGSLFNLGAAGGGAIGGWLLALAGYGALALGLPLFVLVSALLAWLPERKPG